MSKKFFIILILSVGVAVVAVLYVLHTQIKPLVVVSTSPENHGSQNPYLPLIVAFNRAPKENEITVSLVPNTRTINTTEGNTIKIAPATTFLPETQYTVSLNTSPQYAFNFTTQTDIENYPGINDAIQKENNQYHQQTAAQDAALMDIRVHAPISQQGFTINYSYTNDTYTITLASPYDQNKAAFLEWIKQKGVTSISDILIKYVNQ